MSLITSTNNSS